MDGDGRQEKRSRHPLPRPGPAQFGQKGHEVSSLNRCPHFILRRQVPGGRDKSGTKQVLTICSNGVNQHPPWGHLGHFKANVRAIYLVLEKLEIMQNGERRLDTNQNTLSSVFQFQLKLHCLCRVSVAVVFNLASLKRWLMILILFMWCFRRMGQSRLELESGNYNKLQYSHLENVWFLKMSRLMLSNHFYHPWP